MIIVGGVTYWIVYATEIVFSFFAWIVTCGVDMSLGYYVLQYLGEMKLLSSKFKKFRVVNNYRNDLKILVDKHCDLLECHHILEDAFGLLLLWNIIVCAVNLCVAIYQTTVVSIVIFYFSNY